MEEKTSIEKLQERIRFYQNHEFGAETWIEDHVSGYITDVKTGREYWCPIKDLPDHPHPITGRSYRKMWHWQKVNIIRPATSRDEFNLLAFHTIILCMQRGEGKSFINALLILWRFFTQPRQLIILGSNSRDQSVFAMYDILRDVIINSPPLIHLIGGADNIREKNIVLRDAHAHVASSIRSVSAFSGILSNLTAYNFTELFQQKNSDFFNQLDGSRRNIPNAQAYIDSTVSDKEHVLYRMYMASSLKTNKDPGILFVYRFSEEARQEDYFHPNMTQVQLESFRTKFTTQDFARFFKNTWEMDDSSVFSRVIIASMKYVGIHGALGQQGDILNTCKRIDLLEKEQMKNTLKDNRSLIEAAGQGLMPVPYSLSESGHAAPISCKSLEKLTEVYDTHWALGAGFDLADPLKDDLTKGARTILVVLAKGLPGSLSDPDLHRKLTENSVSLEEKNKRLKYIYFLCHLVHVESNEISDVKFAIDNVAYTLGQIQTICGERWGASELRNYAEEEVISLELISPTYERQRAGFNMFYLSTSTGFFKSPQVAVPGYSGNNILDEEMLSFRHDTVKRWYGSFTKKSEQGVQDDVMFAIAWGLYGMRLLTPDDFEPRNASPFMGSVFNDTSSLIGDYD